MNLPKNACPVAYTCIREYTARLSDSTVLDHSVFGGDDDWDELRQESLSRSLEPKAIRLRAFFAVELIYNELLPMQFFAAALPEHQEEWQGLRVDRTVEGMKWLEAKALKSQRRFNARSAIATLKRDETLIQLGFALAKPAETFEKLARVCDVLAGCLRRDDIKGMTIVGSHLAWSMQNAHQTLVESERMVRALLSVGTSNPIHAWQREE
jgi:hypothetical protein